MARLNEPPVVPQPSAETLDAVKRRFLRQNRELAKTNSQQSMRLRCLETDCSRLLAENLSLREQMLQLQNSLEAQSRGPSFANIDAFKDQLEAKVTELGGLVAELAQMRKPNPPQRTSDSTTTKPNPEERQWRSALALQEVENQMMPTIEEEGLYSRQTMNVDEVRELFEDPDSQSPDIGPPPVSRFEEDPITFNPDPTIEKQPEETIEEAEPSLPANLETRKKRRESGPKLNLRRVSVFQSPPGESDGEPKPPVRVGSKRKFSVQDEEKAQTQSEDFRFSRRTTPVTNDKDVSNEEPQLSTLERPVLGSKPVNTDPVVSPKKQRSGAKQKPEKKSLPTSKSRGRLTISRNVVQPELLPSARPKPVPTTEIHLDSMPPKTPAAEDNYSAPSTEPSASRPESKDTPPPGDLTAHEGARPPRRTRPQVSYKEPNLNSKMRRPGKELIDAVTAQQERRASSEPHTAPSTAGRSSTKRESSDEPCWNSALPAAGQTAEEEAEMGSPLRQKLDRREGAQDTKSLEQPKLNSSAASNAISALINETSTAKRKSLTPPNPNEPIEPTSDPPIEEREDKLAIFDFTASSPNQNSGESTAAAKNAGNPRIELAKAARNTRRHSSVHDSSAAESKVKSETEGKVEGALPSLHKRTESDTVKKSSTAGLGKSTASARALAKEKKAATAAGLSAGSGNIEVKASSADTTAATSNLRAERAASRRRSMML